MIKNLLCIVVLISSIFSFGQVRLEADTNKKEVKSQEVFNLTIVLEVNGNDLIQESPLRLPDLSKFNVIAKGSEQNTLVNPKTNTVINQLVYEIALEPKQSGNYKIGSALVQVNGKIYKSEPFEVVVSEEVVASKNVVKKPANDVYVNLELQDEEVYQNQPTIAILRAYSKNFNNLRRVGHVQFAEQNNLNIQPISFARSEIEQNSRSQISSQVIAVVLIFPKESGRIEIKPASILYKEDEKIEKISSNRVNLKVKGLPKGSPSNFSNAVGEFNVEISSKDASLTNAEIDKPINVDVRLSGEGNLSTKFLPKLKESSDYILFKPELDTHLKNSSTGLAGEIVAHYIVIPKKSGTIAINTQDFSYFNPETKKYVNLGTKNLTINVMTPEEIAESKSTLDRVNEYTKNVMETVQTPIVGPNKVQTKESGEIKWLNLLTNYSLIAILAAAFIFVITLIKKRKNLKNKKDLKPLSSVAETEAMIKSQQKVDVTTELEFLKKLADENNHERFFVEFEEFDKRIENQVNRDQNVDLKTYFENHHGFATAENYRILLQEIQVEKFSPLHVEEHLILIYKKIESLYSVFE